MSTALESESSWPGPTARSRVVDLLAGHLLACTRIGWPGADGLMTEDVVLVAYPAAMADGLVPGLDELARRHPDLREVIADIFSPGGRGPRR